MSKRLGGRLSPLAPKARLTAAPNEILTSTPLAQAAMQMLSGDDGMRGPVLRTQFSWDGPPRMARIKEGQPDITGRKSGRLTVMGLLDMSEWPHRRKSAGAAWVVRCVCGMWETRSHKAICSGRESDDKCVHCRTLEQRILNQKRTSFFDRYGRWPDQKAGAA